MTKVWWGGQKHALVSGLFTFTSRYLGGLARMLQRAKARDKLQIKPPPDPFDFESVLMRLVSYST